jgi:hypothetical protein
VFGVVVDEHHRPLAGAAVTAVGWRDHGAAGGWRRDPGPTTTTDATGRYELATAPGGYQLEATFGDRTAIGLGYRADVNLVRHVDIVIDLARPAGTATVFDAATADEDTAVAACTFRCPRRPPGREWWLRTRPCPDDATPVVVLDPDHGVAAVRCQTADGVRHGAFSEWSPTRDGVAPWQTTTGWYVRGAVCP